MFNMIQHTKALTVGETVDFPQHGMMTRGNDGSLFAEHSWLKLEPDPNPPHYGWRCWAGKMPFQALARLQPFRVVATGLNGYETSEQLYQAEIEGLARLAEMEAIATLTERQESL